MNTALQSFIHFWRARLRAGHGRRGGRPSKYAQQIAAVCSVVLASVTTFAAVTKRPNILFILTDDQRWDALGLAGNKYLKTPNMDRIGREGVYFKNTFCTTSLCSPSRASILSGVYAHTHGVTNNFTEYPANFRSFPMVLQAAGYDTA